MAKARTLNPYDMEERINDLENGGGGTALTAGNYIEITDNKINVKMEKGNTTEYEYRLTGAYSPTNKLTVEKYRDGVLVSTESYLNEASYTPIAIDGLFEIWYTAGSPKYYWHYKLLKDSQEHSAGYEDSWYYTDTETRTETFDVEDDSLTLVRKGDLEAYIPSIIHQHVNSQRTDSNGVIFLDLAVDDYILLNASTKDFSAGGPFIQIGYWMQSNVYKYKLRFTDDTGAAKASSNFWVDLYYMAKPAST